MCVIYHHVCASASARGGDARTLHSIHLSLSLSVSLSFFLSLSLPLSLSCSVVIGCYLRRMHLHETCRRKCEPQHAPGRWRGVSSSCSVFCGSWRSGRGTNSSKRRAWLSKRLRADGRKWSTPLREICTTSLARGRTLMVARESRRMLCCASKLKVLLSVFVPEGFEMCLSASPPPHCKPPYLLFSDSC